MNRLPLSTTHRPVEVFTYWQKEGYLLLDPPYQRGDVWGPIRQRNLIFSILKGIPIPSLIVNDRMNANWGDRIAVIDGRQRITTILAFLDSKFSVPGEWFDMEGEVFFKDLPDFANRRFRQTPISVSEGTLPDIYDEMEVFELVNFGGVPQGQSDFDQPRPESGKTGEEK